MSLNRIVIAGRMTADPELKSTPGGNSVCTVRIACDRDFKNKQTGERETDFVNVVTWNHTAEFVSRNFAKGRVIVVDGRLQIRQYTDREGEKRTISEVVAENVYFGDSRPNDSYMPVTPDPSKIETPFEKWLEENEGDLPFYGD